MPPISRKKLSEVLCRMSRAKLIDHKYDDLFGARGVFYQITQNEGTRRRVAKLIEMPLEKLARHGVRRFDLLHCESCAIWAEYLECLLPEARVIREQHFQEHDDLRSVLLAEMDDRDYVPDVMVVIPSHSSEENVYVAVEIERSPKSRERLLKKLKKYADETRLDGLVYVCDTDDITTRLRDVYKAAILRKSRRIGHFSENFFLFSDGTAPSGAGEPKMYNVELEPVSLREWIGLLRRDSLFDRRDANFKGRGSHPGLQEEA